ncbi:MAG: pantoate--beta-alanine ligase, partial [Candidatus Cloacimonetes bacterium]|nr:pantoate--beta-alanine ligase [Candidatus Cloacimonadota bacterium]
MKLIKSISEMQTLSRQYKGTAGFVPTMGYLHDGHLSLVRKACTDCDEVVVSIYVNPSQFGHGEDFQQYPRSLQQDMELLSSLDVKYLFVPQDEEMYRADYKTWVSVEGLTGVLCGKSRPAHFRGVTTIVTKLLHIINPDIIFLGEKDFQQLVVIRQMVRDLNISVEVVGCPLIREKDGLAMSSRNKYLSRLGREKSLCLYRSLLKAQEMY